MKARRMTSRNKGRRGLPMLTAAALAGAALSHGAARAEVKTPPYWASISVDEARMRVGPNEDYPANWVYRRKDLPVKVIQVHSNWRKIEDSHGAQGWMHVRLLADTPTGIVSAAVGAMHAKPDADAPVLFRAEKGVVGRLSECGRGWCRFDVHGRRGYVRTGDLWGAVQAK